MANNDIRTKLMALVTEITELMGQMADGLVTEDEGGRKVIDSAYQAVAEFIRVEDAPTMPPDPTRMPVNLNSLEETVVPAIRTYWDERPRQEAIEPPAFFAEGGRILLTLEVEMLLDGKTASSVGARVIDRADTVA